MSQPRDDRQDDLFRPALEEIINLRHPLVRLAAEIDWGFLAGFGRCPSTRTRPAPTRLVAGLFILKHMHNLSDEMLCDRWVENPYFQYFGGEVVFRHEAPFYRSSLTRWRQRLGEEQIAALLQRAFGWHGIGIAKNSSAWWWTPPCRRRRLRIRPMRGSPTGRSKKLSSQTAKREGVELRQSYLRVAKRAAIMVGRYTHAHQFKRARRQLKFLRTRLGRIIRDVRRKIEADAAASNLGTARPTRGLGRHGSLPKCPCGRAPP